MKAVLSTLTMILATSTVFAAAPKFNKTDLINTVRADSIGRAALEQLKGSNCRIDVKQAPTAQYENFKLSGSCMQPADEVTGGGVYLMIEITGQYWGPGAGEVQKIEIGHAG